MLFDGFIVGYQLASSGTNEHCELLQEREAEFRDQSEATNSRVVRWTLMQMAVISVTCAWQLSHLRSFFIKQKLTWWGGYDYINEILGEFDMIVRSVSAWFILQEYDRWDIGSQGPICNFQRLFRFTLLFVYGVLIKSDVFRCMTCNDSSRDICVHY